MAELFVKQAAIYAEARTTYPRDYRAPRANDSDGPQKSDISTPAIHPGQRYFMILSSLSEAKAPSVDLVKVADAVHWFDLPRFYAFVNRVLRKPGGVIAVQII
ncbi:uncharacterized protein [Typha latifolia]|uniref:uncharacterized protein n=1 Tax=Typha latifolia TaxID=4733 RepID=UPI003C2FFF51